VKKARKHIEEIEENGGMIAAIEAGLPKRRIEEAAARRQARIDSGEEKIIGVNIFQHQASEVFEVLEVDNSVVRNAQIEKIQKIKEERDQVIVQRILDKITKAAQGKDNLLELAVEAALARATLGEISDAMEKVFGRYIPQSATVSGVYLNEMKENKSFLRVREMTTHFLELEGRRPRIMIAKLGQDGHDRGARVIATSFADLGFDVDIGPLFQTPAEAALQAAENDVHVLGISSLAAGHKTLVPETIEELRKLGREDIELIVGGVIPERDYDFLRKAGVAGIFGPGTVIADAAAEILTRLIQRLEN
jgi:methylmalonyl-CoA mutase